jgi:hypothetical protein
MPKSVPNRYNKLTVQQLRQRVKALRKIIKQNNEMIRSLRNDLNTIYPVIKNINAEIDAREVRPSRKPKEDMDGKMPTKQR